MKTLRQLLWEARQCLDESVASELLAKHPNILPAGLAKAEFVKQVQSGSIADWLGGDTLYDKEGLPRVFHHGTAKQFDAFNDAFLNNGFTRVPTNYLGHYFTSDPANARLYAAKRSDPKAAHGLRPGARLISVLLKVKRPLYINEKTYWKWNRRSPGETLDQLQIMFSKGYDAVIMPSVWRGSKTGSVDVVVAHDNQIKILSATPGELAWPKGRPN